MKIPIIVIVGETASGKSNLALDLARDFNGEIINADSWAVYKNFNIGTAKPSFSDRKKIKHHLLDVADPERGFSAVEFKQLAMEAIREIHANGKIPVLVGGTGLYIDCLIYDYSFLPASSKDDRHYFESLNLDELRAMCNDLNYDTRGIDMNNKRRVIRLLENKGVRPTSKALRENTLIIGIRVETEKLEKNITTRINKMFKDGLVDEVESLLNKYGWDIEPMKGIGYREFRDYFENKIDMQELIGQINIDTIKLVKKQRTWFKRNKSIQWYTNRDEIVDVVTTFMNKFS
ncbi:MAG TPA: tRNA (adenosine(37)-N6)-dimethylallyltransferase MiaA [Candidatus Saccharimonadales bacterium]